MMTLFKSCYLRKTVASIVLVCFVFLNNVQNSFASSPAPLPVSQAQNIDVLAAASTLEVPAEIGFIQERFIPDQAKGPLILYVQSAHANLNSEIHTKDLIQLFQKQWNLPLVLLEGGEGKLDSLFFRSFPDEALKEKVLGDYVKQADLSGAEIASILFDGAGTEYFGIEDQALYDLNKKAFLEAAGNESKINAVLDETEKQLNADASKICSAAAAEFLAKHRAFQKEEIDLVAYVKALMELSAGANSKSFSELEKIISTQVNDERFSGEAYDAAMTKMILGFQKRVLPKLPKEQQMDMNRLIQSHRLNQLVQGELVKQVTEASHQAGIVFHVPAVLRPAAKHAQTIASIKGTKLFDELKALEHELRQTLPQSEPERALLAEFHQLEILRDFSRLEITPDDWERVVRLFHIPNSELRTLLAPHFEFYSLAHRRDQVLYQNMMNLVKKEKANVALISTGGFHKDGITKHLKESNIPYLLISPKISEVQDRSVYLKIMHDQRSFMKYFDGSLWDALAKDYAAKLAASLRVDELTPSLKTWRDRIIQNSIAEGRITQAGLYTKYVDALVQALRKEYATKESSFVGANPRVRPQKRGQTDDPMDPLSVPFSEEQIRHALEKELNALITTYFDKLELLLKKKVQVFGDGFKELWRSGDLSPQSLGNLLDQVNTVNTSNIAAALALIRQDVPQAIGIIKKFPPIERGKLIDMADQVLDQWGAVETQNMVQILRAMNDSGILDQEGIVDVSKIMNPLPPSQRQEFLNLLTKRAELRTAEEIVPTRLSQDMDLYAKIGSFREALKGDPAYSPYLISENVFFLPSLISFVVTVFLGAAVLSALIVLGAVFHDVMLNLERSLQQYLYEKSHIEMSSVLAKIWAALFSLGLGVGGLLMLLYITVGKWFGTKWLRWKHTLQLGNYELVYFEPLSEYEAAIAKRVEKKELSFFVKTAIQNGFLEIKEQNKRDRGKLFLPLVPDLLNFLYGLHNHISYFEEKHGKKLDSALRRGETISIFLRGDLHEYLTSIYLYRLGYLTLTSFDPNLLSRDQSWKILALPSGRPMKPGDKFTAEMPNNQQRERIEVSVPRAELRMGDEPGRAELQKKDIMDSIFDYLDELMGVYRPIPGPSWLKLLLTSISLALGFLILFPLHELGHWIAAIITHQKPEGQIHLHPFYLSFSWNDESPLTNIGSLLGDSGARAFVAYAGDAFVLLSLIPLLSFVAIKLSKKFLKISWYLSVTTFLLSFWPFTYAVYSPIGDYVTGYAYTKIPPWVVGLFLLSAPVAVTRAFKRYIAWPQLFGGAQALVEDTRRAELRFAERRSTASASQRPAAISELRQQRQNRMWYPRFSSRTIFPVQALKDVFARNMFSDATISSARGGWMRMRMTPPVEEVGTVRKSLSWVMMIAFSFWADEITSRSFVPDGNLMSVWPAKPFSTRGETFSSRRNFIVGDLLGLVEGNVFGIPGELGRVMEGSLNMFPGQSGVMFEHLVEGRAVLEELQHQMDQHPAWFMIDPETGFPVANFRIDGDEFFGRGIRHGKYDITNRRGDQDRRMRAELRDTLVFPYTEESLDRITLENWNVSVRDRFVKADGTLSDFYSLSLLVFLPLESPVTTEMMKLQDEFMQLPFSNKFFRTPAHALHVTLLPVMSPRKTPFSNLEIDQSIEDATNFLKETKPFEIQAQGLRINPDSGRITANVSYVVHGKSSRKAITLLTPFQSLTDDEKVRLVGWFEQHKNHNFGHFLVRQAELVHTSDSFSIARLPISNNLFSLDRAELRQVSKPSRATQPDSPSAVSPPAEIIRAPKPRAELRQEQSSLRGGRGADKAIPSITIEEPLTPVPSVIPGDIVVTKRSELRDVSFANVFSDSLIDQKFKTAIQRMIEFAVRNGAETEANVGIKKGFYHVHVAVPDTTILQGTADDWTIVQTNAVLLLGHTQELEISDRSKRNIVFDLTGKVSPQLLAEGANKDGTVQINDLKAPFKDAATIYFEKGADGVIHYKAKLYHDDLSASTALLRFETSSGIMQALKFFGYEPSLDNIEKVRGLLGDKKLSDDNLEQLLTGALGASEHSGLQYENTTPAPASPPTSTQEGPASQPRAELREHERIPELGETIEIPNIAEGRPPITLKRVPLTDREKTFSAVLDYPSTMVYAFEINGSEASRLMLIEHPNASFEISLIHLDSISRNQAIGTSIYDWIARIALQKGYSISNTKTINPAQLSALLKVVTLSAVTINGRKSKVDVVPSRFEDLIVVLLREGVSLSFTDSSNHTRTIQLINPSKTESIDGTLYVQETSGGFIVAKDSNIAPIGTVVVFGNQGWVEFRKPENGEVIASNRLTFINAEISLSGSPKSAFIQRSELRQEAEDKKTDISNAAHVADLDQVSAAIADQILAQMGLAATPAPLTEVQLEVLKNLNDEQEIDPFLEQIVNRVNRTLRKRRAEFDQLIAMKNQTVADLSVALKPLESRHPELVALIQSRIAPAVTNSGVGLKVISVSEYEQAGEVSANINARQTEASVQFYVPDQHESEMLELMGLVIRDALAHPNDKYELVGENTAATSALKRSFGRAFNQLPLSVSERKTLSNQLIDQIQILSKDSSALTAMPTLIIKSQTADNPTVKTLNIGRDTAGKLIKNATLSQFWVAGSKLLIKEVAADRFVAKNNVFFAEDSSVFIGLQALVNQFMAKTKSDLARAVAA